MVTILATIANHLWEKIVENSWKTYFDDANHHNLLFYKKLCSMGQWKMFSYFMVSPKEAATLMTPYSNPMAFYSHWFINKNVQKQFKKSLYIDVDL